MIIQPQNELHILFGIRYVVNFILEHNSCIEECMYEHFLFVIVTQTLV